MVSGRNRAAFAASTVFMFLLTGCSRPMPVDAPSTSSAGAVTGIHHVLLTVGDLPRSIHFYRDVLGLRLEYESGSFAMLQAGSAGVALSTHPWDFEKAGEPKGVGMIPHLTTDDMQAFAARLTAHGIPWLRQPVRESFGIEAFVADPDGYQWAILAPR